MVIPLFSLKYQLNCITFFMILLYKHQRVKHTHTEHVFDVVKKIMVIIILKLHQLGHDTSVSYLGYPISTLPEHLHSTSLSYAETTLNSRKLVFFPLIAHYLSAGPPLPPPHPLSPGDPATPTLNHHS